MTPPRETVRVLHVDDESEILEVTGRLLEAQDDRLAVESVRSTTAVLDRLDEADCIVADYVMPEMDGAEFVDRVRRSRPDLPVVFFTGRDADELADAALGADLTAHVRKGVSTDQYGVLGERVVDLVETAGGGRDAAVGVGNGPGE
jgi:CheY-like chemotaxis protein